MAYLELKGIEKFFGAHRAIKGIDLEIQPGEFIVFVGPSGCGKSTLLRLIAGLEHIDGGQLNLDGRDITHLPSSKRDLAMVFQSYALYPHMSVYENMSFALKLAGESKKTINEKVTRAADILNLTDYLERTPGALSGGQRQRVAIGRAIVRAPKVFLFDEPLSNLDAALRGQTRVEIAQLHRDLGATTIYVTHDQVEAMTLADRVVVLRDGLIDRRAQFGANGLPQRLFACAEPVRNGVEQVDPLLFPGPRPIGERLRRAINSIVDLCRRCPSYVANNLFSCGIDYRVTLAVRVAGPLSVDEIRSGHFALSLQVACVYLNR